MRLLHCTACFFSIPSRAQLSAFQEMFWLSRSSFNILFEIVREIFIGIFAHTEKHHLKATTSCYLQRHTHDILNSMQSFKGGRPKQKPTTIFFYCICRFHFKKLYLPINTCHIWNVCNWEAWNLFWDWLAVAHRLLHYVHNAKEAPVS